MANVWEGGVVANVWEGGVMANVLVGQAMCLQPGVAEELSIRNSWNFLKSTNLSTKGAKNLVLLCRCLPTSAVAILECADHPRVQCLVLSHWTFSLFCFICKYSFLVCRVESVCLYASKHPLWLVVNLYTGYVILQVHM